MGHFSCGSCKSNTYRQLYGNKSRWEMKLSTSSSRWLDRTPTKSTSESTKLHKWENLRSPTVRGWEYPLQVYDSSSMEGGLMTDETPKALEMEQDDVIEVYQEQTGGMLDPVVNF